MMRSIYDFQRQFVKLKVVIIYVATTKVKKCFCGIFNSLSEMPLFYTYVANLPFTMTLILSFLDVKWIKSKVRLKDFQGVS